MTLSSRRELCKTVDAFTDTYAQFVLLKDKVANGEILEREELSKVLDSLNKQMEQVYLLEKENGFEEIGIPLEDANFNGFRIQNGELTGELSNAYLIACPWYCDFSDGKKTEKNDFFKFFIASYLTHMVDMYEPSVLQKALTEKPVYRKAVYKRDYKTAIVKKGA